jgi:hypothetical protein
MEFQVNMTEIIVGIISFCGIMISSIFSFLSHVNAKQANKAVNGVGPNKPRIYDITMSNYNKIKKIEERQRELIAWKDSYKDSPWSTGEGVRKWLEMYEPSPRKLNSDDSSSTTK